MTRWSTNCRIRAWSKPTINSSPIRKEGTPLTFRRINSARACSSWLISFSTKWILCCERNFFAVKQCGQVCVVNIMTFFIKTYSFPICVTLPDMVNTHMGYEQIINKVSLFVNPSFWHKTAYPLNLLSGQTRLRETKGIRLREAFWLIFPEKRKDHFRVYDLIIDRGRKWRKDVESIRN